MPVQIEVPTIMRQFTGGEAKVEADGVTLRDVFEDLDRRYPGLAGQLVGDDGGVRRFVNIYLDDEDVRYLDALDTKVKDGSVVSILPAVAGG